MKTEPGPVDAGEVEALFERKARLTAYMNVDGASPANVLYAVAGCALSWDRNARLVGNVRAGDIVDATRAILARLTPATDRAVVKARDLGTDFFAMTPREVHAALSAAPAPALVWPYDATPEMVAAALKVDWSNEDEEATAHNVWHAMRAAMPTSAALVPDPTAEGEAVAWRQKFKSDPWTYHHADWPYAESERAAGAIVEPLFAHPLTAEALTERAVKAEERTERWKTSALARRAGSIRRDATIAALTEERDRMRRALEPFTRQVQHLDKLFLHQTDDHVALDLWADGCDLTVGDFRRAAEALRSVGEEKGQA